MTHFSFLCLLLIPANLCSTSLCSAGEKSLVSVQWKGVDPNPVFTGRPGKWDDLIRERGWVMKDGNTWKLWYTGYNKSEQPLTMKMGYATSADGITWKRWRDDPIYDESWVEDMMVIKRDDHYFMFAEGAGDQSQLLESEDGIHWSRTRTLNVRQVNGKPIKPGPFGTPTVFVKNDVWHLYYERYDSGIWLARSTDLKTWTNVSDDPLIVPGPDHFDARMIAMNQIVQIGDRYIAIMHGTGTPQKPRKWCTYFVESRDLLNWTKSARGPVLPIEDNKSSGVLVHDGTNWRLHTMHSQIDVWFPEKQ